MVILLTGTINTNSCINVQRTNINDRTNDYYQNIKSLLDKTDVDIVFVENSNHDLGIISEFLNNNRIEILQFDGNNFDRNLGKGFGERNIINYAIENSVKLKDVDYLIKLTGRYSINLSLFYNTLNDNEFVFYKKDTNLSHLFAFTGFFKMPKLFWVNELSDIFMSDDPGCYIENAVANKLVMNNSNITYVEDIGLEGISGTHDIKIG
jgi:hypothetical protein